MDFNFTETQGMLRDTLRRYLADTYDFDKRAAMLKREGGRDPGVWKALATELGILGAALPEQYGGFGGSPIDTMVLMGSIGNAQGDPGRWWFAAGGAIASIGWFFVLGYGARALTRFFATPRSWQILDGVVAVIMLVIAARLAFGGL